MDGLCDELCFFIPTYTLLFYFVSFYGSRYVRRVYVTYCLMLIVVVYENGIYVYLA